MYIPELLKEKRTISFEVFPPKNDKPLEPLMETLRHLYGLDPDFLSVTYGAGGTNAGRATTICNSIAKSGNTVMAHFTCIGLDTEEVKSAIDEFRTAGVQNLLLLRGDLPEGWTGTRGSFDNATELIRSVREVASDMAISAAAYPETHLESDPEQGIEILKEKQDLGVSFFMTQLCYDVDAFACFLEKAQKAGVTAPMVVGVMPVLKAESTIKMTLSNGCSIPADVARLIGRWDKSPEDFRKAGKEYTLQLIERFKNAGADGIHLYTLNKYEDVVDLV